jgi:hypothetical protein
MSISRHAKLTNNQVSELSTHLHNGQFKACLDLLTTIPVNYKSLNQIKNITKTMDIKDTYDWGMRMLDHDTVHKIVGVILLENAKIWERDLIKTRDIIIELAKHDDWRIRKASIDLLRKSIIHAYQEFRDIFVEFLNSDNPFNRRVAISVAKEISSLNEKHNNLKDKILELIDPIIHEQNPYVISVANDTLANGFLKFHGSKTNEWILAKAASAQDIIVKISLLSIYTSVSLVDYIDEALSVVEHFLQEDDERVRNARASTLRAIAKYEPSKLSSWLETRLHIKQAVDHWAELESEGLLRFEFV